MSASPGPRPLTVTPRPLPGLAALLGTALPADAAALAVTGVTLDSSRVAVGDLYAGLRGAVTHGARFAGAAAAAGAVALLTDDEGAGLAAGSGLPALVVPDPRARLGEVAADVYGHPGRDLLPVAPVHVVEGDPPAGVWTAGGRMWRHRLWDGRWWQDWVSTAGGVLGPDAR